MWDRVNEDVPSHVTWDDAKMELEVWASDNGVRIKSENLNKGDMLNQAWSEEHGPALTEKEFAILAPKVLGVDPLPDGPLSGW
jgi:hypothetical protein